MTAPIAPPVEPAPAQVAPQPQPAPAPAPLVSAPVAPAARPRHVLAIAIIAAVAIGAAAAVYFFRTDVPPSGDTRQATPAPAPDVVLPHVEIESRPPLVPATPEPPVLQVEIATVRPVWLRATVDGHRAIERQVPAGTRMTFTPSDSITIRAGDAGAVRVKIGAGPDEPLGRDGQVLTRVFVVGSPR